MSSEQNGYVAVKLLENLPDVLFVRSDGAVCYRGTGVKFHIFVNAYQLEHDPEVLESMFGTLDLDDVLRLIDCYLENRAAADKFVADCNSGWDDEVKRLREWQATPEFQAKRKAHIEHRKRKGLPPYDTADRDAVEASR